MSTIYVEYVVLNGRPNRNRHFSFSGNFDDLSASDLDDIVREEIVYRYNCEYSDIEDFLWNR